MFATNEDVPKPSRRTAPFTGNLIQIDDETARNTFVAKARAMAKLGSLPSYIRVQTFDGGYILTTLNYKQICGVAMLAGLPPVVRVLK
jgi:hypothetical protein